MNHAQLKALRKDIRQWEARHGPDLERRRDFNAKLQALCGGGEFASGDVVKKTDIPASAVEGYIIQKANNKSDQLTVKKEEHRNDQLSHREARLDRTNGKVYWKSVGSFMRNSSK